MQFSPSFVHRCHHVSRLISSLIKVETNKTRHKVRVQYCMFNFQANMADTNTVYTSCSTSLSCDQYQDVALLKSGTVLGLETYIYMKVNIATSPAYTKAKVKQK